MPTISPLELQTELHLARRTYAGAVTKASQAWALIQEIRQSWILLPKEVILTHMERISAEEDEYLSRAELSKKADSIWPEQIELGSTHFYIFKPFFTADWPKPEVSILLDELGLGNLSGCFLPEISALNLRALSAEDTTLLPASGLSTKELQGVINLNWDGALSLVNTMRHLFTTLQYIKGSVKRGFKLDNSKDVLVSTSELLYYVETLEKVITFSFTPKPALFFGTEANKVNSLKALPSTEEELASLLPTEGFPRNP